MFIDQEIKRVSGDITNMLISDLQNKLESYFIEGLKRKGFEFENKYELECFVKTRCTRTNDIDSKEHIYYVDNIAFFLHKYEIIYESPTYDNNVFKMSANYGSYAYL